MYNILQYTKKAVILSLVTFLLIPNIASALTFNPNLIISDNDLENGDSMSVNRIQRFLGNQGNLGGYSTLDPWGNEKSAAQIIFDAGHYWTISPQYLLVRMQIEQSLITGALTDYRLNWATGYGVCDGCSTTDPEVIKYRGFFNQVNWGARKIRESYLTDLENNGMTFTGWGPGITKTTGDGYNITPANDATAAMYTYTPWVYNANYNIWNFYNSWFAKNYPDGSLLQVHGEHGVYLIQNGKKRAFLSRTALISRFDASRIILVSYSDLDAYEDGLPFRFANYSLIRSTDTGRVFLIDGNTRRYIESPEVFRAIGFNPEEIENATEAELVSYSFGPNINMQSIYPTGVLLQSKETGGISYVENGIRQSIWSKEILQSRFPDKTPVIVEQATIDQYTKGDPVKFKDGELITSPGMRGVYFISNGQRRGIASKETFEALGLKWENLIWTTDRAVEIHIEGEPIDIEA
ncbi:hypothetical protein KKF61_05030 [Patescibacteria group bacterium]|nr:hypothetical protein [Patescibacteria group bacterium]MBU0963502.1 hypothetical protein [Patescibacteria group bacterium]